MTTSWTCDVCGEQITSPSVGWIEWLEYEEGNKQIGKGLRLVHHCSAFSPTDTACQYVHNETALSRSGFILHDLSMERVVGVDGLSYLLSMLEEGVIPQQEIVEVIRRIHVPGYEKARLHFDDAVAEGIISPPHIPVHYTSEQILAVIDFIDQSQ